MVTQTTKVNKNKGWTTERCQSRLISKSNTSLLLKGIKFPGCPDIGAHGTALEGINLGLQALHLKSQNWESLPSLHSSFCTPTLM